MPATVRKLAQLAGVSHVTVLRALHGRDAVSPATRKRILALARKHHFPLPPMRTPAARKLLNILCSIVNIDEDETQLQHGFNRRLLDGLTQGAATLGVELMNCSPKRRTDPPEWPLAVNRKQVDGVITSMGSEPDDLPPCPPSTPAIFIFSGLPKTDMVTIDNFDGGRKLGEHLATLGHRKVAYIGPDTEMSVRRLSGLRFGVEAAGGSMSPWFTRLQERAGSRESAIRLVDQLLELSRPGSKNPKRYTALMAYNDYMAAAAILHLRKRGIRVPEDLSVVGFDHVTPDWYDGPALTTVAMPLEEIGAESVRFLYWRIAHPDAPLRRLVLMTEFVAGTTTQQMAPPQRR